MYLNDRPPEVDALLVPEPALRLSELHDEVDLGEAVHAGQLAPGLRHATMFLVTEVGLKTFPLFFFSVSPHLSFCVGEYFILRKVSSEAT